MKTFPRIFFFVILPAFFLPSCIFMGPAIKGEGKVTEETREIKGFENVEVSRGLKVFLVPDSVEYLEVEADGNLHEVIVTGLQGKTLQIYTDKFIRSAKSKKVYVHFRHLNGIKSTSGAMVSAKDTVRTKTLEIAASSGSRQTLAVRAGKLEVRCSSGAHVSLTGEAVEAAFRASTGAHVAADKFIATRCEAKASTGGHVRAGMMERLEAVASSGGQIYYAGTPDLGQMRKSSGGLIEKDGDRKPEKRK